MEATASQPRRATGIHYVVAIFLPIIGVILGIIQFARGYVGPGFALLLTSTLAFFFWLLVLASMAAA